MKQQLFNSPINFQEAILKRAIPANIYPRMLKIMISNCPFIIPSVEWPWEGGPGKKFIEGKWEPPNPPTTITTASTALIGFAIGSWHLFQDVRMEATLDHIRSWISIASLAQHDLGIISCLQTNHQIWSIPGWLWGVICVAVVFFCATTMWFLAKFSW